jgi:hypothetical protein
MLAPGASTLQGEKFQGQALGLADQEVLLKEVLAPRQVFLLRPSASLLVDFRPLSNLLLGFGG